MLPCGPIELQVILGFLANLVTYLVSFEVYRNHGTLMQSGEQHPEDDEDQHRPEDDEDQHLWGGLRTVWTIVLLGIAVCHLILHVWLRRLGAKIQLPRRRAVHREDGLIDASEVEGDWCCVCVAGFPGCFTKTATGPDTLEHFGVRAGRGVPAMTATLRTHPPSVRAVLLLHEYDPVLWF